MDIYSEIKSAVKDALIEFYNEIKQDFHGIPTQDDNNERLLTIKQFSKKHSFITEAALRSKCFNSEWNKFDSCLSRVGRKILLKEKTTLEWFSNPPLEASWTYDQNKYNTK